MKQQTFNEYLKDTGLAETSASEHLKNIERFEKWAKENNLSDINLFRHQDILEYVQQMKSQALSVSTLNIRITSLRKYFEYLKEEECIENNPVRRLRIKGTVKRVIVNPLSYTELENLYTEYAKPKAHYSKKVSKTIHKRNAVILGLLTWQAIHAGMLHKIEVAHVNLNEGLIYIPSTGRSNARELKLDTRQMVLLHSYLTETSFKTEKLFECHPHNTMQYLLNELKGINPAIRNAAHIRASVLLHWIKIYDKRQVQYMAGHRWISSTENYEVQELSGLIDLLSKHHPFG